MTNNIITDDEIRRRLDDAAAQMPLTRPTWNGPTVSLTTTSQLDARRPRRWLAAGVAVAAAAALIGVTVLAMGSDNASTTLASQPTLGTVGIPGIVPSTTAVATAQPNGSSPVQCGSEPRTVGSGIQATERRSVPAGITGVVVRGCAQVSVSQGPNSVMVTADDNLLAQITTTAVGTSLVIDVGGGFSVKAVPTIAVALDTIADLRVEGTADVNATGIAGAELSISISGSGTVTATGTTTDLNVSIDGEGDVDTSGLTTTSTSVEISGTGDVAVASVSVSVTISGTGNVTVVTAGASISATITGAGIVFDAAGNPVDVDLDVSIPDVTLPDVSIPDMTLPDVSIPDVTLPDVSIPDATLPDVSIPDVTFPDLSSIERDLDAAMADLEAQLAALDASFDS